MSRGEFPIPAKYAILSFVCYRKKRRSTENYESDHHHPQHQRQRLAQRLHRVGLRPDRTGFRTHRGGQRLHRREPRAGPQLLQPAQLHPHRERLQHRLLPCRESGHRPGEERVRGAVQQRRLCRASVAGRAAPRRRERREDLCRPEPYDPPLRPGAGRRRRRLRHMDGLCLQDRRRTPGQPLHQTEAHLLGLRRRGPLPQEHPRRDRRL